LQQLEEVDVAKVRTVLSRMKNWFSSDRPRKGPGPGDGNDAEPFNRARAEIDFSNTFGTGGGKAF
jgi:hypothetical protein